MRAICPVRAVQCNTQYRHRRPVIYLFWLLRAQAAIATAVTAQFYKTQHHAFSEPSTSTSAFLSPHRPRPPTRADIRSPHAPLERRNGGPSFLMLPAPAPRCPAHLICPNASLWVDSGRERLYPQKHACVANPSLPSHAFLLLNSTFFFFPFFGVGINEQVAVSHLT